MTTTTTSTTLTTSTTTATSSTATSNTTTLLRVRLFYDFDILWLGVLLLLPLLVLPVLLRMLSRIIFTMSFITITTASSIITSSGTHHDHPNHPHHHRLVSGHFFSHTATKMSEESWQSIRRYFNVATLVNVADGKALLFVPFGFLVSYSHKCMQML